MLSINKIKVVNNFNRLDKSNLHLCVYNRREEKTAKKHHVFVISKKHYNKYLYRTCT